MSTVTLPPLVNDQGNINVHIHEGGVIPILLQDNDGNELDASSLPLFFEIVSVHPHFRKALDPDPNNPEGRLLSLSPEELVNIPHGASFCLADESGPIPVHRWEGRIFKRG